MNTKANEKICPGCLIEVSDDAKPIVIPCQVPNDLGIVQKISVKTIFCSVCAELYKALPASTRRRVRERFNRNLLRGLANNDVRLVLSP